jgi:large subunit ribosomal protein L10
MKKSEKETFVAEFRERRGRAPVIYFTDFTGLDVKSMSSLRQSLRDSGAEYVVGKNRLVKLALQDAGFPDLGDALIGPTGVVFGYQDVVAPAKVLSDFAKDHENRPAFKAGVLEGSFAPEQITQLAKLPSREVLLSQLAGALQAPMAALAGVLEAKLQEMVGLLEALKEKREGA